MYVYNPFFYVLSLAAFALPQQNGIAEAETICLENHEIFTMQPFIVGGY